MPPPVTLVSKLKVQLKMAIQRLRMLQSKSTAIAKQQRRAMAELLAAHKLESARIRVENIIRSDIGTELHEILELYCELLLARISLLEGPVVPPSSVGASADDANAGENVLDSGLDEAVRSILYAAPRCDIKELSTARALLVDKFGKEYALLAAEGKGVPERVVKRVRVETPKIELVDAYLREIGRTYGVRFPGDPDTDDEVAEDDEQDDDDDDEGGSGGGVAESVEDGNSNTKKPALNAPLEAERDLARATPPRDLGETRSPLRIAPPSPTTENPKPSVKLPQGTKLKGTAAAAAATRKSSSGDVAAAAGGGTASTASSTAAGAATGGSNTSKKAASGGSTTTTTNKSKDKLAPGGGGPGGTIPNVDELAKRFAALKRG